MLIYPPNIGATHLGHRWLEVAASAGASGVPWSVLAAFAAARAAKLLARIIHGGVGFLEVSGD
jgi:hypothetical protein